MILITSDNGTDLQLLRESIAGQEFKDHFISQVGCLGASEILSSVGGGFVPSEDVLFIEADVWFSKKALSRIRSLSTAASDGQVIRFTEDADGDKDDLAVFCPVEVAGQLLRQFGKAIFQQPHLCKQVIEKLGKESVVKMVESHQLDSEFRPLRLRNKIDLTTVESHIFFERACELILSGVKIRDPRKVFIYGDLQCGSGVQIDLDVIFEGQNSLADGVHIGAHSILKNAKIGAKTRVNPFSIIEDAAIGANSFVGPYGRIRPGSTLGDSVQIGNFVEIKNSSIETGTRINHLAFIGDSTLGKDVTIGAGTITCNHNGAGVSHTHIGAGAYIGSGCELVAPITIGENSTIGAGSTITEDVPSDKLTLARSRQITVENWSRQRKDPSKK